MAKVTRRSRGKPEPARYLLIQDTQGNVYLVTPDRLGAPIDSGTLKKAIARYVTVKGTPLNGVEFALLGEADTLVRMCGINLPSRRS